MWVPDPADDQREVWSPGRRVATCGTLSGHQKHVKDKTPICEPCRMARRAYQKEWKQRQRAAADTNQLAEQAATAELIRRHRAEYTQLRTAALGNLNTRRKAS